VKDKKTGDITEIRCTYDPETKGGDSPDGRKVKATLHWVSAPHALEAEVRLYDKLFTKEDPDDVQDGMDFTSNINPHSLSVLQSCRAEPELAHSKPYSYYQFERLGYFAVDPDTSDARLVFNRAVSLRDPWAKIQKAQKVGR
jgi:glutaminyl-tRNA synthetase